MISRKSSGISDSRARLAAAGFWLAVCILPAVVGCRRNKASAYEFAEVKRGDIENVVSSTGQMEPVGTVEVGTQVSGTVERVLVDFNSEVKKSQLLAVLDTVTLSAQLRDAEAGLARVQAQWAQAKADSARAYELHAKGLSSDQDLEAAKVSIAATRASLLSAESALDRARANLAYAFIRSPISGTVIGRNVEPGQTVAASFSTPTLFIIAQDLSRMRILAQVDESDIGQVDSGVPVKFTVQAYPDKEFAGSAVQVRLQPTTSSGVVTYTVVVDAENEDNKLLPGMTATVDFYVEQRKDVLTVPATALSLNPTEEMVAQLRKLRAESRPQGSMPGRAPDSVRARQRPAGDTTGSGLRPEMAANAARLWYVDEEGRLAMMPVITGATDGRNTEVTPIRGELTEGMKVIVKASGTPASGRFGPPGGGFGGRMFRPGR